jgi:hypothetical protein
MKPVGIDRRIRELERTNGVERHVAWVNDFEIAVATYWPTSRCGQEARIIEKIWEG